MIVKIKRRAFQKLHGSRRLPAFDLAWYAEFLLEIDLKNLPRKTGARLNFKIALMSLHIDPGPFCLTLEEFHFLIFFLFLLSQWRVLWEVFKVSWCLQGNIALSLFSDCVFLSFHVSVPHFISSFPFLFVSLSLL